MTNWRQGRSDKNENGHVPFVCHKLPYVFMHIESNIPFVGEGVPIVGTKRKNSGFTLVELMVTLIVAAILFGIAIPNLRTFIQNSRMTTQSNDVVGELALARSEAIKLNQNVVICRSANPTAASPTCSGAGAWDTGWIVFMDNPPVDNTYSLASGDVLIRQHDALAGGITMIASDATLASNIVFTSSGQASSLATRPYFKLCDNRGASFGRAIVFEPTGRAHIDRQSTMPSFTCN